MTALDKAGLVGLCDCERGHNGCGMVGRLCDCQPAMTTPTVAAIAGKLSERARGVLLCYWPCPSYGLNHAHIRFFNRHQLIEQQDPTSYRLTPLGLAVRAYLQEQAR